MMLVRWILTLLIGWLPLLHSFDGKKIYDTALDQKNKQLLFQRALNVDQQFQKLFSVIEQKGFSNIKYADLIGTKKDYSELFPATLYSRFRHFCRILKSYRDYPYLRLSNTTLNQLTQILGYTNRTDSCDNLSSTLQKLIDKVLDETQQRDYIEYLLTGILVHKEASYRHERCLPFLINQLYDTLCHSWMDIVKYKEIDETHSNIFALMFQLQKAAPLSQTGQNYKDSLNIGILGENDPHTLWGKVTLVQRIICSVLQQNIPVHYQRFHHLLTHETCSISAAIQQTIDYITGKRIELPSFTIENRLDALHQIFKMTLAERLVRLGDFWPNTWVDNSAQTLIEITRGKQDDLAGWFHVSIDALNQLYRPIVKNIYSSASLNGQFIELTNALMHPGYTLDDQEFAFWNQCLGSVRDVNKATLLGILNFCRKNLNNFQNQTVFQENENLLNLDHPENPSIFLSLVQKLLRHVLQTFQPAFEKIQALVADKTKTVTQELGSGFSHTNFWIQLSDRLTRLVVRYNDLCQRTYFQGTDLIIEALDQNLHPLLYELQSSLLLETIPERAWWDRKGPYGKINHLLQAIEGQFFSYELRNVPPDYALIQAVPDNFASLSKEISEKSLFLKDLLLQSSRFADAPCLEHWVSELKQTRDSKNQEDNLQDKIQSLFKDVLAHFYSLFINIDGPESYQHSLRQDLDEFLGKAVLTELKLRQIGSLLDTPYQSTLLGRLAHVEHVLHTLWRQESIVPVSVLLDLRADFCNALTEDLPSIDNLMNILNQMTECSFIDPLYRLIQETEAVILENSFAKDSVQLILDSLKEGLPLLSPILRPHQVDQLAYLLTTLQTKVRNKDDLETYIQEMLLRATSLFINSPFPIQRDNVAKLLQIKETLVPGPCLLFCWNGAIQSLTQSINKITDNLNKGVFITSNVDILKEIYNLLSQFKRDVVQISQNSSYKSDFSDVWFDIAQKMQNFSALKTVQYKNIDSWGQCETLTQSFQELEIALLDLAQALQIVEEQIDWKPYLYELTRIQHNNLFDIMDSFSCCEDQSLLSRLTAISAALLECVLVLHAKITSKSDFVDFISNWKDTADQFRSFLQSDSFQGLSAAMNDITRNLSKLITRLYPVPGNQSGLFDYPVTGETLFNLKI